MVDAAFVAENIPALLIAGALGIAVVCWGVISPRLALLLLVISVAVGQAARLAVPGQGGGLLLSDVAMIIVLLSALVVYLRRSPNHNKAHYVFVSVLTIFPFLIWALYVLTLYSPKLSVNELFVANAYWIRLASNLLLLPALLFLALDDNIRQFIHRSLLVLLTALAGAGFLQLIFLPNLVALGGGWDPHEGRLVTTWFDPNFSGALFALGLLWLGARAVGARTLRSRWCHGIAASVVLGALLLTQSRGSLVVVVVVGVLGMSLWVYRQVVQRYPMQPARLIAYLSTLVLVVLGGAVLLGERLMGVVVFDPSAIARIDNLASAWHLVPTISPFGVGYNAYQFASDNVSASSFLVHSRAGADSSLLTLWVTTGLFGVLLFLTPWLLFIQWGARAWWRRHSGAGVAVLSLMVLSLHASITNSFLYSHLLILLTLIIGGVVSPLWFQSRPSPPRWQS